MLLSTIIHDIDSRITAKYSKCKTYQNVRPENIWFDWCCFYYFLRNSLVALLEALFAAVILESRSWMIVESKIVQQRENSCYSWTELNIENGEIGSRSRLYQPEAFGPSGPGLGLSTRNNFCFFPFFLCSHPLPGTVYNDSPIPD